MKLNSTIDLLAGGDVCLQCGGMGSGCNPRAGKCGRKKGSGSKNVNPLDKYFQKYKKQDQYVTNDSAHTAYRSQDGSITVHEHPGKKQPVTVYYRNRTDSKQDKEQKFSKQAAILHLRDQYKIKHKFHLL